MYLPINMNWKFKLTSDNILASLMASTVSSGCSSPTNISFKTFLNVLRKKCFSYKKILQTCSGRSLFNNEFWSLFQRFFWWTLNLPHIDSFFFFFYHGMENKIFFAHFLCVTLVHFNNRVESWRVFFTTTIYFIQTRSEDSFGNVWLEKILHGQTCLICYAKLLRLRNENNFSFESAPFLPFRNQ